MSIYTVDDTGQIFVTPSELDEFEYYRDNIFVRTYEEFLLKNPYQLENKFEIIASNVGIGIVGALFVDSNGDFHLYYRRYDASWTDRYATNKSGSWAHEVINTPPYSNQTTCAAIMVDASGYAHICYIEYTSSPDYEYLIKYATNATGSWVESAVDATSYDTVRISDIFMDGSGYIHIIGFVYDDVNGNKIRHWHNTSGWANEVITTPGASLSHCPVRQKSNGDFIVVWTDAYNAGLGGYEIKYATGNTGSWSINTTNEAGYGSSTFDLDSSEYIHISTKSYPDKDILHIDNVSGWNSEIIQNVEDLVNDNPFDPFPIFIDSNDKIHIHIVNTGGESNYLTNKSGSWVNTVHLSIEDEYPTLNSIFNGIYYDGNDVSFFYRGIGDTQYIFRGWI